MIAFIIEPVELWVLFFIAQKWEVNYDIFIICELRCGIIEEL